ncbi:MAG: polyprenyl synthetase family protein [Calditrichaeota bacterium]|nr:MAG: polyprenyl synthetase family protein [Calditrichota bacterium]
MELFHDFTLIHDDIMDQDELRRGFQTLHVKYDSGTAILVGDALIGLAYEELLKVPGRARDKVFRIFTEALVKVCEGQALDKEFENRDTVTLAEYLDMISKKTAWLFQTSCALGGLCAFAPEEKLQALQTFGYAIGLGFQIQDDLLDFIADQQQLGKTVGSDFRMHKKTFVTLKYEEMAATSDVSPPLPKEVSQFTSFSDFQEALLKLGIVESVKEEVNRYIDEGLAALEKVAPLNEDNPLYLLTRFLQQRQY